MKYTNYLFVGAIVAHLSCSSEPANDHADAADDNFDRSALLRNVTENVLLPTYEQFRDRTAELVEAVGTYCDSLEESDELTNRTAAEQAWKNAMIAWQWAELMQVGPTVDDDRHLHDLVYSWPVVSGCAVDQEVMALHDDPGNYDITQTLANRRGLDANEYALFSGDLGSECAPQIRPAGWDALSDTEKRAARCAFVKQAASDLAAHAQTTLDKWTTSGAAFMNELIMAGTQSSRFASEHAAVNALFGALFYIDTVTKDEKLGQPTGLIPNACSADSAPCLRELESQYARHSKENIAANLTGFRRLFFGDAQDGSEGSGFDDYLVARGRGDVAEAIRTAVDTAQAAVEEIPGSASEALQSNYNKVVDAHAAVRAVTDSLKNDVPDILSLEIPTEAGGDND